MALTAELLQGNAATAELTPEQIASIVELSRNDESSVIGQKTGEIYGGLDADILATSGMEKNGTEKTYDYAKRVIGALKDEAGKVVELQGTIDSLTKEKERLEKAVAGGASDAELKKELAKAKADLDNVTGEYATLKAKYDEQEASHAKALVGVKIDAEIASATAGVRFKSDIPKAAADALLKNAIEKVKGMSPEYIDDGEGGKVLAFMENGTPLRNKENSLRPFTAAELVQKELSEMGVLDTGRKLTGAGTKETKATGENGSIAVDITGAKSQSEAHEAIRRTLLAQGLTVGSKAYQDAMDGAWREHEDFLKKLPL